MQTKCKKVSKADLPIVERGKGVKTYNFSILSLVSRKWWWACVEGGYASGSKMVFVFFISWKYSLDTLRFALLRATHFIIVIIIVIVIVGITMIVVIVIIIINIIMINHYHCYLLMLSLLSDASRLALPRATHSTPLTPQMSLTRFTKVVSFSYTILLRYLLTLPVLIIYVDNQCW